MMSHAAFLLLTYTLLAHMTQTFLLAHLYQSFKMCVVTLKHICMRGVLLKYLQGRNKLDGFF